MPEPRTCRFDELAIGDTAEFEVAMSLELIDTFALFSGDHNPLHTDDAYGATTRFGRRIPHGMIAGALFSRLIGMELPGRFAVYLSQTLSFRRPFPLSGTVIVRGEIIHISSGTRTITLRTEVAQKETKLLLVDGEALVHLDR